MATNPLDFQTLARFAASGILNCLIAGIAFALLAWAFTNLLRPQGASTRFAVWFLALVAVALFPWAGLLSVPSAPVVGAARSLFPNRWHRICLSHGSSAASLASHTLHTAFTGCANCA